MLPLEHSAIHSTCIKGLENQFAFLECPFYTGFTIHAFCLVTKETFGLHIPMFLQWLSGRVLDETEGPRVRALPASLRCGP